MSPRRERHGTRRGGKHKRNTSDRLVLHKYDPMVRKRVEFKEAR